MRRLHPFACASIALLLQACSSSDPKVLADEGTQALGAGDAALALEKFDAALSHMEPASPDFLRVQMGRFQALARRDPARTKNEFLAFHAGHTDKIRDVDFKLVIDELLKKGAIADATEIVKVGKQSYGESPVIKQLVNAIGDAAKRSKDAGSMQNLKGLGYSGGAEEDEPAPKPVDKKPE